MPPVKAKPSLVALSVGGIGGVVLFTVCTVVVCRGGIFAGDATTMEDLGVGG